MLKHETVCFHGLLSSCCRLLRKAWPACLVLPMSLNPTNQPRFPSSKQRLSTSSIKHAVDHWFGHQATGCLIRLHSSSSSGQAHCESNHWLAGECSTIVTVPPTPFDPSPATATCLLSWTACVAVVKRGFDQQAKVVLYSPATQ